MMYPFLKDASFCTCFCFVHTIAQFSRILRFSHVYCQIFRIRTHGWRKWRTTALMIGSEMFQTFKCEHRCQDCNVAIRFNYLSISLYTLCPGPFSQKYGTIFLYHSLPICIENSLSSQGESEWSMFYILPWQFTRMNASLTLHVHCTRPRAIKEISINHRGLCRVKNMLTGPKIVVHVHVFLEPASISLTLQYMYTSACLKTQQRSSFVHKEAQTWKNH